MKIKFYKIAATILSLLIYSITATAEPLLPKHQPIAGGIAVLDLPYNTTTATYLGKPVYLVNKKNNKQAVVGIPLSSSTGKKKLIISTSDNKNTSINFNISNSNYKQEFITLKNKRKVNPNNYDMVRIGAEKQEILAALDSYSPALNDLSIQRPVLGGRVSSSFGLKRFFNKQPRKPHSGIDIALPIGTPVFPATKGKVVAVGDYFFNGKTVIIDHGNSLLSMYCHLSKFNVKISETVDNKTVIGEVGMSGRSTGPHLHWGMYLNATAVNPELFLNNK